MGQKVHPQIIRIGISKNWSSKWFAEKNYAQYILEDVNIRKMIASEYKTAGIASVEVSRSTNDVKVTIHTSKPGVLIGRGGAGIEELRKKIEAITKRKVGVVIEEVLLPENHAVLVGRNIADQIEKRIAYRRAVKVVMENAMKTGIRGLRVKVGGRLNGADIARSETFSQGKIPLSTLRENIDYAIVRAETTYGVIGIKVWVFQKEGTETTKERKIS